MNQEHIDIKIRQDVERALGAQQMQLIVLNVQLQEAGKKILELEEQKAEQESSS